jgi:ribosome silencing factor RsfS/YbeB/iojap
LVDILKKENARKLCVIKIPRELKYVDYFCIVNGISYRHMIGMAQFVRKCYKLKRRSGDIIPKIEGEQSKDWICMDLGNIALHIFTEESREFYDLESLWCLGEDYEKRIKDKDNREQLYASYLQAASAPINVMNTDKTD